MEAPSDPQSGASDRPEKANISTSNLGSYRGILGRLTIGRRQTRYREEIQKKVPKSRETHTIQAVAISFEKTGKKMKLFPSKLRTVNSSKPTFDVERNPHAPMIGLQFTSRVAKRTFSSLRTKPLHLPPTNPTFAIPSHEVVDEERFLNDGLQDFYPARPGETLGDNYQLLAKIGWGTSSTVWLARDLTRYVSFPRQYCSMLIVAAEPLGINGSPSEQLL